MRLATMSQLCSTESNTVGSGHQWMVVPCRSVLADHRHGGVGNAAGVGLPVDAAALVHLGDEPLAERVDHRRADAVQPARDLVAAAAELAARVQLGEHQLEPGLLLGGVHVDRDAAAVVDHRHRVVAVQGHDDGVALPRESLVDGVVDDLADEVVQTARVGRADVHPGALAHRLEPLERGELGRGVGVLRSLATRCGARASGTRLRCRLPRSSAAGALVDQGDSRGAFAGGRSGVAACPRQRRI